MDVLLLSQWITTGFMTGLIWFIQIVHYPIYSFVGHNDLSDYQAFHVRRTTMVVFPFMVTELLGGGLLLLREWHGDRGLGGTLGPGIIGRHLALHFDLPNTPSLSNRRYEESYC